MVDEAVILAGGFGTRLKDTVKNVPKPMAPIKGKPFLVWLLSYLEKYGIKKVILATGYMHETISSYFGTEFKNLSLIYSIENKPLGTGGAAFLASEKVKGKDFLLLNGDTYFEINLYDFEKFFKATGSVMSVVLRTVKNTGRYGTVILDNDRILSFSEKFQEDRGLINGGIYLINKEWYRSVAPQGNFSLEKNILEKKIADSLITGFVSDSYFIDIGIPEDYLRAIEELPSVE